MIKKITLAIAGVFMLLLVSACSGQIQGQSKVLNIISGSENRELEPIIKAFSSKSGIKVNMEYQGSVDIMTELQRGAADYDGVWPANSIWLTMGDEKKIIRHEQSVMSSPVVFGIKTSLAESLGFIGKDVSVKDIMAAIESDKLRFAMTSATQSNSGACAYLGFLSAILEKNTPVTTADLSNTDLQMGVKKLLSGVNRSSGSSDWLKELLVENPESIDAMVNYESLIIAANKELTEMGEEPLYIIYPYDGMSLSDSPLAYVDKGDEKKEAAFLEFQEYLMTEDVQKQLNDLGRRTGVALNVNQPDPDVWREDWGADAKRTLPFIDLPSREVILEALELYQSALKKPSATVYCLDFSGSMDGDGNEQLVEAMETVLDQRIATENMLQNAGDDYTAILAFSDQKLGLMECYGNSQDELYELYEWVGSLEPTGGTDIYSPAVEAIEILNQFDDTYIKSVVLMTDGKSNSGMEPTQFEDYIANNDSTTPVYSIMFGEADDQQLNGMADLTTARIFDGRTDLVSAFKQVRGYY